MKPKRKRAWRRAAYKRKRNPSRATGARYNNTHIADAKKMLCLADKSCGEEFSGYRTVYSGKPPWNEYEKLEFYVFEKRTPYSSMWDWIVVDPSFRSKVVATGELYERRDGDGLDTSSAVVVPQYRRKGIYTNVLAALRKISGVPIWSDRSRTAGAEKVWRKYRKQGLAEYSRSYDRWKMKNPRRR